VTLYSGLKLEIFLLQVKAVRIGRHKEFITQIEQEKNNYELFDILEITVQSPFTKPFENQNKDFYKVNSCKFDSNI
jgi:hypothetical protein